MSVLAEALALSRLVQDDASWRLLRADNAPIVIALLAAQFGGEQVRLPAEELFEALDHDLDRLREGGFELPLSGRGYATAWREAGFLVRRPADGVRGETFELSPESQQALRHIDQLRSPRSTVTESRLASIVGQLNRLAIDTDPDQTRRLASLHAERDRIDAQIERAQAGELDTLDPDRARERLRDILTQAGEIPADFARVRAEFETLNRQLRVSIVESDAAQSAVLDDVFRGVDLIADSDAGRSFAGFSALVLDPEVGAAFDGDVSQVLDRDFTGTMTPAQRRFLRRFITLMKDRSGEIHDVVTTFARGLRQYVQSQDFQRDRVLTVSIRAALAAGVDASKRIKPYRPLGISLDLTAVPLASVGSVLLHDPAELDATAPVEQQAMAEANLEAMRRIARETEIDFDELRDSVNDLLAQRESCTVADVLAEHPATQGVASVVGLIALAAAQGTRTASTEQVRWRGVDDIARTATVPQHRFTGRVL